MTNQTGQGAASVVSEELLALLVCPVDKAAVRAEGDHLVCTACGRKYRVEDGIPNMLVHEAT